MKYFNYLSDIEKEELFYKEPQSFTRNEERDTLAYTLGATLYMPGIREGIASDIIDEKIKGLMSIIICLEDAVGDLSVEAGVKNVVEQIVQIDEAVQIGKITLEDIPLIFIRVRNPVQIDIISNALAGKIAILSGFVFPKFSTKDGEEYLEKLEMINKQWNISLYAMPVLETRDIMHMENRIENLMAIKELLGKYRNLILNVRIGVTDFSSLYSLRRSSNSTLYDILIVRDCMSSILNVFGREDDGYVISGPVWEYFSINMKSETYFTERSIEGLIKEGRLDRENGFVGKTLIHPSQILPIQALHVISHEEYLDACDIISSENYNKGVVKSSYRNKMNEIKPHLNWARKIIKKSNIYGVYNENRCYEDLFRRK